MIVWNDAVAAVIEKRLNDIEKKQAERFPKLLERLDRIENSFPAIVDRITDLERSIIWIEKEVVQRIETLENKQNAAMYNIQYPKDSIDIPADIDMDFSGAFESDIEK